MDVKAIAKDVRISPIKIRLMVDLIRGKNVNDALNILTNRCSTIFFFYVGVAH